MNKSDPWQEQCLKKYATPEEALLAAIAAVARREREKEARMAQIKKKSNQFKAKGTTVS